MANDLAKCYSKDNLRRAWRWINSNPSSQYKNYFRDLYSSYALSIEKNIDDLSSQLKNNSFLPSVPSKILLPKSACITRPFTLLTVEDQIVYQAFVNIIAEKHLKVAKKLYYDTTFGNLYAGKTSTFFYRKWEVGYNGYNKALKNTYSEGYCYLASFDLTACYDSIDHKMLIHFMDKYGLDKEFSIKLCELLGKWSTTNSIFKGHGIPQGPMASGLLSETILYYFDQDYKRRKNIDVKYFRYVDDIRLMAKEEYSLKRMLARLDYNCKQIGLFPQSSKIEIHKVTDITKEIKQLSVMVEEVSTLKLRQNDKKMEQNILKLIKNNEVIDVTQFKIYLANIKPNSKISQKILDILSNNPKYSIQVLSYLKRYPIKIPNKVFDRILVELYNPEVYQIVNAHLIQGIQYNLSEKNQNRLKEYIVKRWEERNQAKLNPIFRSVLVTYLINHNLLSYSQLKNIIETEEDWWVTKTILRHINAEVFGEPSYLELMRILLKKKSVDIAITAAHEIMKRNYLVNPPYNGINYVAQKTLKFAGIINRAATRPSIIPECLGFICKKQLPKANWKKIMSTDYKQAEKIIVRAYGYVQNDMSAFVNILDSFNDMLLHNLVKHDKNLPGYTFGKMGSVTNNVNTKLEMYYPRLFELCKTIHDKRLECDLSHPITKASQQYTKPIEYKFIYKAQKLMIEGYTELIKKW